MFPCRRSVNMPFWIFPACLIVIFLNSETHEFVFAIFSSNGGGVIFLSLFGAKSCLGVCLKS